MDRVRLDNLVPSEYEHPFDKNALHSLESTPGLPLLLKTIRKYSFDKIQKVTHTGSYLQITENQYPKIYDIYNETCEILDIKVKPRLYLMQMYQVNAYATCFADPIIVLGTGCMEALSHDELRFMMGHELGHVKSQHLLYHDLAGILSQIGSIIGDMTLGIGAVLSLGLQVALMYWSRMSEFTSDRAGMLACQDFETVLRVITKMAGVARNGEEELNLEEFLKQARNFEGFNYDTLDKFAKVYSVMYSTHPWTVARAAEMEKWVAGGEYDRVIGRKAKPEIGDYYTELKKSNRCKVCDSEIGAHDKFCSHCGNPLN